MPIYDHSYRHWDGELKSHAFRWWVIAKRGLRVILRRRLFLLFILAPPIVNFLVSGVIIYGIRIYGSLFKLDIINPKFFFDFFTRQTLFIGLICVFGGSGLIADDLKNNALQLYLSKPLTRLDYLVGKFAIVMVLIGFVTIAPGVLLFIENIALSKNLTVIKEEYWILGSIILYSVILALPTGLLILALSSTTKNYRYAAIGFVTILIGTPIFSEILRVLNIKSAAFASYWSNLDIIGKRLFGLPSYHDWYWAMFIILGIMGLCVWVMHRNVKGVKIAK